MLKKKYNEWVQRKKHDNPFSFRAPVELAERLDKYAEKLGLDRSSVIKLALYTWLDRMDDINGKIMPDLIISRTKESIIGNQRAAEDPLPYGDKQGEKEHGKKIV